MAARKDRSNELRRQADGDRRLAGKASDGASRQSLLDKADECEEQDATIVATPDSEGMVTKDISSR